MVVKAAKKFTTKDFKEEKKLCYSQNPKSGLFSNAKYFFGITNNDLFRVRL